MRTCLHKYLVHLTVGAKQDLAGGVALAGSSLAFMSAKHPYALHNRWVFAWLKVMLLGRNTKLTCWCFSFNERIGAPIDKVY